MNIKTQLSKVKHASKFIFDLNDKDIKKVLYGLAEDIELRFDEILKANLKDLKKMNKKDPMYDRLLLDKERIVEITESIRHVADLSSPLGVELEKRKLQNGLKLRRVSVPFGVIGVIYESRPNVTLDVFTLCFKSGNACVLKGGKEADNTNKILVKIIKDVLRDFGISPDIIFLMSNNKTHTKTMLKANEFVDLIIPRGSAGLIKFIRENATVPIIETGAGVVHTYFDRLGDIEIGKRIIENAKTRRPAVCNSLDTLIIHKERLDDLPRLVLELENKKVEIFADHQSFRNLQGVYSDKYLKEATEKHFGKEYLSLKMSIKTVSDLDDALLHIEKYSSKHSESIISNDKKALERFRNEVDAAVVYTNSSTAFTDGGEFELGAEIGISTQKLHARGPMALDEIVSYKWIVDGDGQVRG